jgi:hypothetical protein
MKPSERRGEGVSFSGVLRELFKLGAIPPRSKMECVDCGCLVRKHDKYKILAVKHVSCLDSRLVGQKSLPIPKDGN